MVAIVEPSRPTRRAHARQCMGSGSCAHDKPPKPGTDRNQQYSITALTDGGGTIIERYAYTAYGQVTFADAGGTLQTGSASNNRYTYTGREWDAGLSLYHYRARMYDAVAERFASRDPIGFNSTDTNLHRFVFNQPLVQLDPSGLKCTVYVPLTHGPRAEYIPKFWETVRPIQQDFDECDFVAPGCCWMEDGKRKCRENFGGNDRDPVQSYWPDYGNAVIDFDKHRGRIKINEIFNHFLRQAMKQCCPQKSSCDCRKSGCDAKISCHKDIEPMIEAFVNPGKPGLLSSNPCGKVLHWNCRRNTCHRTKDNTMPQKVILACFSFVLLAVQQWIATDAEATECVFPASESAKPGDKLALAANAASAFRWCPPGTFEMGSPPSEVGRYADEIRREKRIGEGFWIGENQVTQSLWVAVMKSEPWIGEEYVLLHPSSPATFISHDDAVQFCVRYTRACQSTGELPSDWEFRLPTEVEWEYACRAGSRDAFCYGNDPAMLANYAWYSYLDSEENPPSFSPQPVGRKMPNAWGLFDVHGNVYEWCGDWYFEDADRKSSTYTQDDPPAFRVLRGGGWNSDASKCRCAYRSWGLPEDRLHETGFRLVLSKVD